MRILFITTVPNSALNALKKINTINLHLVDCANDCMILKEQIKNAVSAIMPTIIITYRCPYILPEEIFNIPLLGSYNLHPTLLPKYAGLNPWIKLFDNKETVNGVTLHKITSEIDSGEIIYQEEYMITPHDTIDTARQKADCIAAKLVVRLINMFMLSKTNVQ